MSEEKTYRFISDPGHKENLSGRVRAACVTCRRKKIKCSGFVPCSTCEEKGVLCEGLTDRKRPTRSRGRRSRASSVKGDRRSSRDSCLEEGSARSQRNSFDSSSNRIGPEDDIEQRPTAWLRKLQTESSEDSGYASPLQSPHESSARLHLETRLPLNYQFTSGNKAGSSYAIDVSPSTKENRDWNHYSQAASQDALAGTVTGHDTFASPHISSAGVFLSSANWPGPDNQSQDGTHFQTSTNLLTAAQTLEEQALSLRRLASSSNRESMDEARRQTIMFPIYNKIPPGMEGATQTPLDSYDDLTLACGGRLSGTGLTPLPIELNPLWAVNPSLNSSFGYQSGTASEMSTTMVPNMMEGSSEEWMNMPNVYGLTMDSGRSEADGSDLAVPQGQNQGAGRSTSMYRYPHQRSYGQLHPWPE